MDGSGLDQSTMDRLLSIGSGHRVPSSGEMGCYLSHRKAWNRLLDDGFDCGFIAEDDVHLANASRFLQNSKWLPAQFDLIKADTTRHLCEFFVDVYTTYSGHTLRRPKSYHPGGAGYFISRRGAVRLLGTTESLCDAIDDIMFDPKLGVAQSLISYQLDPAICVQDRQARYNARDKSGFKGTIEPGKLLDKPEGIAKFWREVSRPFARAYHRVGCKNKTWRRVSIFKRIGFAGDD